MEITYKRSLQKSYMYVKQPEGEIPKHELAMLQNYRIPCLLPMTVIILDGQETYAYDISGKQQVFDYLCGRKLDREELCKMLFSLQKACSSMPEYLLHEDGICLEEEFVYKDLEDGSLNFAYQPFERGGLSRSFRGWMEKMLKQVDHKDSEAVELAYAVYQETLQESVTIRGLLQKLMRTGQDLEENVEEKGGWEITEGEKERGMTEENSSERSRREISDRRMESGRIVNREISDRRIEGGRIVNREISDRGMEGGKIADRETIRRNNAESEEAEDKAIGKLFAGRLVRQGREKLLELVKERISEKVPRLEPLSERFKKSRKIKRDRRESSDYQPVFMPGQVEEEERRQQHPTVFLGKTAQGAEGRLIYQGVHGQADFKLGPEEFLIGKSEDQVDGIVDAEGISRLHARIQYREGSYYLEDLNSTNGTFVNGELLEYHQVKKLEKNDRIRFAEEEYAFC